MKHISKILFGALLLSFINLYPQTKLVQDQCFVCHDSNGDKVAALFKKDVHFSKNISCSGCHGGNSKTDDMDAAMNANSGYVGVPKGDQISLRCINCHANAQTMKQYGSSLPTDQYEMIQKSVHWQKSTKGTEHILQCTTCHNAHGIAKVNNPASPVYPLNLPATCSKCHSNAVFMRSYNPSLPVDQYQKYKSSVHGVRNLSGDPKAAVCSSCHGSHYILKATDFKSKVYPINIPSTCAACHSNAEYMKAYKIPTDQLSKYTLSVHGKALFQKNDLTAPTCNSCHGNHGATPPGVESISKVCGTCHVLNAQLFSASPHKQAFDKRNYPECETCHKYHDIVTASNELLGVDKGTVCARCHSEKENKKGFAIAKHMRSLIDSLESDTKIAKELVNIAEQKGMEVSDAKFNLRDANQARLESRTMVHSIDIVKFREIVNNKGLKTTAKVKAEAQSSIDEFFFRRYGLAASVLIISLLALALFFYIRQIESKKNG